MDVEMTKISPKGQVVIPASIRDRMEISAGSRFAVYGTDDVIVFKRVDMPTSSEMKTIVEKA